MTEAPAPLDEAKRRKLFGYAVLAGGATLLLVSRSSRVLLRRLEAPVPTEQVKRTRLKDLASVDRPHFDFVSNRRLLEDAQDAMAPSSLSEFLRSGVEETEKPRPEDEFNHALFAAKAFGVATLITVGTFGAAAYALAFYYQAWDLPTIRLRLKHEMPKLLDPLIPKRIPAWLQRFKFDTSAHPIDDEALKKAYQEGGVKQWLQELEEQSQKKSAAVATPAGA